MRKKINNEIIFKKKIKFMNYFIKKIPINIFILIKQNSVKNNKIELKKRLKLAS